jgi:hypothetical protein
MPYASAEIGLIEAGIDLPFSRLLESANGSSGEDSRSVASIQKKGCKAKVYVFSFSWIEVGLPMAIPGRYANFLGFDARDKFVGRADDRPPKGGYPGV